MVNSKYIWRHLGQEEEMIRKVMTEHSISRLTAKLLLNRKLMKYEAINRFLNPDVDRFHDPYLLKGMKEAIERLLEAKEKEESITIYGDYDVDGITSTSILYMYLKETGFKISYYIPDRLEEGYGINKEACKKLHESGTDIIISVDTGITAVEEVDYCNSLGVEVIITDHHEPQEELPRALAVIDPKREDCAYPFNQLAGVGVTFKLIQALSEGMSHPTDTMKYLDIVAIGTVADIVPLVDENRIIVKHAFSTIPHTWNYGLAALLEVAGYEAGQEMTSGIIGFRVGPRLNAAGRLGDAKRGVELFTTESMEKAKKIAKELNDENAKRQEMEQVIYEEAVELIEVDQSNDQKKVLVVASENWHHGVIGIVASRITEKYYKPSIILCVEEGKASGSARSVEGFSIFDALIQNKDLMDKFGGHEMAAGMSLSMDNVELLSERLNKYADKIMEEETLIPKLKVDEKLKEEAVDLQLISEIDLLRPYGMGNPEPVFAIESVIKESRAIGKEKNHLKVALGSKLIDGIGFGMGEYTDELIREMGCTVVGKLDRNEWRGQVKPQIMLKDIKAYEQFEPEDVPDRQDFVMIYKILVAHHRLYGNKITIKVILSHLSEKFKYTSSEKRIVNCMDIFQEIGVLTFTKKGQIIEYLIHQGVKADLEASKIFQELKEKQQRG